MRKKLEEAARGPSYFPYQPSYLMLVGYISFVIAARDITRHLSSAHPVYLSSWRFVIRHIAGLVD